MLKQPVKKVYDIYLLPGVAQYFSVFCVEKLLVVLYTHVVAHYHSFLTQNFKEA